MRSKFHSLFIFTNLHFYHFLSWVLYFTRWFWRIWVRCKSNFLFFFSLKFLSFRSYYFIEVIKFLILLSNFFSLFIYYFWIFLLVNFNIFVLYFLSMFFRYPWLKFLKMELDLINSSSKGFSSRILNFYDWILSYQSLNSWKTSSKWL